MPIGYCFFNSYVYVSSTPIPPYVFTPFTGAVLGTGGTQDRLQGITIDPQQFVYVSGYYNASASIYDRTGTVLGTLPAVTGEAAFACRFSNTGVLQYSLVVDTLSSDQSFAVTTDSSSNLYMCGYYGGAGSSAANIMYVSPNGNVTVMGTLSDLLTAAAFTTKFDSAGALQYSLIVNAIVNADQGQLVTTDSLNSVYFGGFYVYNAATATIYRMSSSNVLTTLGTLPATSSRSAFVTKFNSTGALQYTLIVEAAGADTGFGAVCDSFANVYFCGSYNGTPNIIFRSNANTSTTLGTLPVTAGSDAAFTIKCSDTGVLQYSLVIDGASSDISYSLACDPFSNVYIGGQYGGTPNIIFVSNANVSSNVGTLSAVSGTNDGFVSKFTNTGTYLYSYVVSGSGADVVRSVFCDPGSNLFVAGEYATTASVFFRSNANVSTLVDTFPTVSGGTLASFVSKFDQNGTYFYTVTSDSSANDSNYSIEADPYGNFYFGGQNQNGTLRDASTRQFLNYSLITPTQLSYNPAFALDALSSSASSTLTGTFSLRRVLTSYTGPVVNVRRSADSATANVFSDKVGTLTLSNTTPLSTWLGASTGFVTTWYDQSGNARHASQTVAGSQPSIDLTNLLVNFGNPLNAFLEIASPGCMSTGDGLYTCVIRHGTLAANGLNVIFGSGTTTNGVDFGYDANTPRYFMRWTVASAVSDVCSQNNAIGPNQTVTYRYTTPGGLLTAKEFWVNGSRSAPTQQTAGSSGTAKNTATSNNYIGRALATGTTFYANTSVSFLSLFSSSLSIQDRIIAENQNSSALPLPVIPARLGAYYVEMTPNGSTSIPQLGYYPNFARIFNASSGSQVNGLTCDPGSNLYVAYSYNGSPSTIVDQNSTTLGSLPGLASSAGALTKFDTVGTPLFSRIIDSSGTDVGTCVAVDSTANVYVGSTVNGAVTVRDQTGTSLGTIPAPSGSAAVFSKFSSATGNYLYSLVVDSTSGTLDQALTVTCDPGSNVYIGGSYNTGTANINYVNTSGTSTRLGILPSQNSGFLVKCDPVGALQYSLLVYTTGGIVQATQGSVCDTTGNVYMTGYTFGSGITINRVSNSNVSTTLGTIPTPASYAAFTVKFDPTGNLLYSFYVDSSTTDITYSPSIDLTGNVYVGGYYGLSTGGTANIVFVSNSNASTVVGTLPSASAQAAFLSKFSNTGTYLYSYVLDTAGTDASYSTACDLYGNVYFTGEYTGTPTIRYVSNSNVATSIVTLPASSGVAAYMVCMSPTGLFNYARIVDTGSTADRAYTVTCDPSSGNVFMGGQVTASATIKDHLNTTISTLPNLGTRGFVCEFLASSTPVAQNLVQTLSNVYYTTVPFMGATTEARLVDTDVDVSGNVYFISQRSTTAPVLTSKNGVTVKTMPPTSAYATTLVKFNNKCRYEWDVYTTNFGNASIGPEVMCSLTHENSNVYIGSQQTAASPVSFFNSSNVVVNSIPASGGAESVDCYISKFDTTGTFQWKSYVQGAQNYLPSVSAAPNDNAVYLAGSRGGVAQMNVFSTSNVSVANIPTADPTGLGSFLVKYDREGTYQWRAYMDSATIVNRGVAADAKSNVYIFGHFSGATTANVYASTGSTRASAITKTGTNNAVYVVKYLTDGSFSWYAFMNTGGVAQQFGQGCDPQSNVYVTGFTTPNMDIFDRTNYSVARSTITGPSGFLVKFSEDGYYQWYARAYSPTGVTFDKVGTDVDFDSGSNVYATFSFLTPSVGASSTVAIQDSTGSINTVNIGVINASFNMVVKFSSTGTFIWACPQTTVVQGRCNSSLSVYGSNVYVSGTKLTTATTIRDRNLTSSTTIPVTSSNAAYVAHYLADGSYAFSDFQMINN